MTEEEKLRDRCARAEFYSYGTSKIFEKRAKNIGWRIKTITFLGFLSPILAGGLLFTFSSDNKALNTFVFPALSIALLCQSILSLLSLCYKWEEKHSYAIGAIKSNTRLFNKFSRLRQESYNEIVSKIKWYEEEYDQQEAEDSSQGITGKEERYAMRRSLMYFKKPCQGCNNIPKSLKPSNCAICGN